MLRAGQRGGITRACRAGIGDEAPFGDCCEYVEVALAHLEPHGCGLLLMLDEFDKLQEGIDNGITSPQVPENIRFLVQAYPKFSAVLTGSRRLKRLHEEYWSALFGLGTRFSVTALSDDAARRLVEEPVPDPRFQILGPNVPPMIGRVAILERVWGALTKAVPSHLSIVGPRYAGKSVFLSGLLKRAHAAGSPYAGTILWDGGHLTPSSNADFMTVLSRKVAEELRAVDQQRFDAYAEQLGSGDYGDLREVTEALQDEQVRVLLLLDGLDRPLAADTLTRNFWDQLRELASQPSLRLVTPSRGNVCET